MRNQEPVDEENDREEEYEEDPYWGDDAQYDHEKDSRLER